MKDLKLTKKPHFANSLAVRISLISILFLVIPLFLQTFFLYRQEYNQKLKDVEIDLKMLAQERVNLIEKIIQMDWSLLDSWQFLQNEKMGSGIIEKIPQPPGAQEHFIAVSLAKQAIYVGKKEFDHNALAIPISFEIVGSQMPRAYPIQISLIGEKERVLWSNEAKRTQSDNIEIENPIFHTNLRLRLEVSRKEIQALHLESYYLRFASLLFFIGGIGGAAVYLLTKRVMKPLKNLCKTMERVSDGASHARFSPDRMGFEINALGIQFNQTLDRLLEHAERAEKERLRREKLVSEFRLGREIQASLLPKRVLGFPGLDIASRYFSSKEVNGDFYDLFTLEKNKLLIAVADVAGKGILACLFSLGLRSMLRSIASVTSDLSEIIKRVNDLYMIDAHEDSMFATLWLGIYDSKTKKLFYSSQGHPPAVLLRKKGIEELWTEGIALGTQTIDIATINEIELKQKDRLIIYTDGIIEAHNSQNKLYGKKRLLNLFSNISQDETSERVASQVIEDVHLFAKDSKQHDDMTLLVIQLAKEK